MLDEQPHIEQPHFKDTRLRNILNRNGASPTTEKDYLQVRDDIHDALMAEFAHRARSVVHPDNFFVEVRVLGGGKCEVVISAGHPMRSPGDDLRHATDILAELDAFRGNSFRNAGCEASHYAHRARYLADSVDDMAAAVNNILSAEVKPVHTLGENRQRGARR